MRAELPAGADGDGARELVLRDGLVRQRIHPHRNLKSVESYCVQIFFVEMVAMSMVVWLYTH